MLGGGGGGGISSLLNQKRILSYPQQIHQSQATLQKSLCSTHLAPSRHVALVLPNPLLLLPLHLSEGLQIWHAGLFSPPLPSFGGFIPIQLWSLGWHQGWQREGELMPLWQDEPWWRGSNSDVWQIWSQAGRVEGEMINESQKCCSWCTVSATGLWRRSENLTPQYMQAVSPKAGSSSLAFWQPQSSWGRRHSRSHYFMTCQKKARGKKHTDCPVLCSSFSDICVPRNTGQTGAASSFEPAATGSQALVLRGPSQMLGIGLEDANW